MMSPFHFVARSSSHVEVHAQDMQDVPHWVLGPASSAAASAAAETAAASSAAAETAAASAAAETAPATTWAEAAASPTWRAMEGYLLNYEREQHLAERKNNLDAMMGAMQEARAAKEREANMKNTKLKERDEKYKQKLKDPAVRRLIKAEVKKK